MAGMITQFHGLPSEILEFARDRAIEHGLYMVAVQWFPDKLILVDSSDMESCLKELQRVDRVFLTLAPPDMTADSDWDFIKKNPDSLHFTIGEHYDEGLMESDVSAKTDNPEALVVWRKIIRKVRAITSSGGFVVNSHTGSRHFHKNIRYTALALEKFREGVKMRQHREGPYMEFGAAGK